jgi:putative holliday junction resolvase
MQVMDKFSTKLEKGKPLIGIDYGTVNIGVSISDSEKLFTVPCNSLKNDKSIMQELSNIIKAKGVCGIVIGYPFEPSGNIGKSCKKVDKFVEKLTKVTGDLPYFYQDERLTTKAVRTMLKTTSWNRKKKDKLDDSLSACYILQTTLDLLNKSSNFY